ncbi:MAG: hypothetical protein HFF29_00345, partial [Oscillospiraceae bacterium]|nr:hypothetical protein [Oscillospiraceae bacterium]
NAGYIKGHGGYFNPYDSVTGYEALAMILRAIGYDKNGEFTGATWETNVSALATQLGILKNIKTTHYGNTLYLASRRDVVAELLFQADAKVPMVIYTPAFGYQPYGMTDPNGGTGSLVGGGDSKTNPTLGERVFGLAMNDNGVLIGNQQTGETGSVMGYAGSQDKYVDGTAIAAPVKYNQFTWQTKYDVHTAGTIAPASGNDAQDAVLGNNVKYELESGIDLIGHNLKLWYDNGNGIVSNNKKHVFAYFDLATKTDVVKADDTALAGNAADTDTQLGEAAVKAGFTLNDDTAPTAVFNNSFGKFGSDFTDADVVGSGELEAAAAPIASPVKLYKLVSNGEINGHKNSQVDAVIALNIETSRITESNVIRNVHTLGMPVGDDGTVENGTDWDGTVATMNDIKVDAQLQTTYIDGDKTTAAADKNLKKVGAVVTGVIAKDAVVGNSTTALRDYEMGIHITGTSPRSVSNDEHIAINGKGQETSRYLLHKVEATVEGKVVAYNATNGTVTLDNGTVLNRSKYYNTVVNTAQNKTRQAVVDANGLAGTDAYALPQSIDAAGNESYNFANYKFYTDYEGKYLGAERTYGNDFLYATYVDYAQDTSSSAYIYKVTGVDMNGEVKTVDVSKFWADDANGTSGIKAGADGMYDNTNSFGTGVGKGGTPAAPTSYGWANNTGAAAARKNYTMTGTNNLGVPFRDTWGFGGQMNYIGAGVYRGMTISGGVASPYYTNPLINTTDYGMNMQRLGIQNAAVAKRAAAGDLFNKAILIGEDQITLGVVETVTEGIDGAAAADRSNLFFNEETKFILVDGYGTANVVHEVYDGISELKGDANYVTIDFNATRARKAAGAAPYAIDLTGEGTDTWTVMGGEAGAVTADSRITESADWNAMTYFTSSAFTYDQTGATAKKVNTIILPKQAVYWDTTTSTSYYMGNPQPTLVSSHEGTPIYQYTVYNKGVAKNVWLTNVPGDDLKDTTDAVTTARTAPVKNDTFLTLGNEVGKTDSGEPYYTATFDAAAKSNIFVNATTSKDNARLSGDVAVVTTATPFAKGAITSVLTYSATTREAQAGTFTLSAKQGGGAESALLRVVEANVTNLNAADSPKIGTGATAASGYVWPDITDVASLNAAASINPVTGMSVRVAIEREGLKVTQVYVCWDQNLT